jgi:membrane protease YdiL (CAAX protease family)
MKFSVEFIVTATFGLVSLSIWWLVFKRSQRGETVVAAEPRRDVPWQGQHVAVAFLFYLLFPVMAEFAARWQFDIPLKENLPLNNVAVMMWLLAALLILRPLSAGLIVTFLRFDMSSTIEDLGFSLRRAKTDIMVGLIAFLAIGPIVYTLQDVLTRAYTAIAGESPGVHPLIKTVESQPTQSVLLLTAVSAVLVAPVVEEFIFRAVLQGWLEKLFRKVHIAADQRQDNSAAANAESRPPTQLDPSNPYAAGDVDERQYMSAAISVPEPVLVAPIFFSSLLFAIFHIGHGLAPIPLFFLALVLGFLYQRTHRILPCVVVHLCINGLSMLYLWLAVINGWPLS